MVPSHAILLVALCGYFTTTEAAVGTTCSANGGECGTAAGMYCDTTNTVCKCADTYATGSNGDTTCTPLACTAEGTCTTPDTNSRCVAGACTCKFGFHLTNADDQADCLAVALGAACTSGTCDSIANAYCDTTDNTCKCGAAFTATGGACPGTACSEVSATTDTCTTTDSHAECVNLVCSCMDGYDVWGTSNKCASASGGMAVVYSATVLIVGVVASFLRM